MVEGKLRWGTGRCKRSGESIGKAQLPRTFGTFGYWTHPRDCAGERQERRPAAAWFVDTSAFRRALL